VRPNFTITHAVSTHRAAELVAEGKVQACLTTQVAADLIGLKTLNVAFPTIPMLWTIFANKND
jgi:prephenate dehydratase